MKQSELGRLLNQCGVVYDDDQFRALVQYSEHLNHKARPLGLVGFPPEQLIVEVARSLLLLFALGTTSDFVDVGTGAGLPGLPLGILSGGGTLLDPKAKAVGFLETVKRELHLPVDIVHLSAEEASRKRFRESFGHSLARGLGPPEVSLELCAPLVRVGGSVILTASEHSPELQRFAGWDALGLGDSELRELEFNVDIHQVIHIVQKVEMTGSQYPRKVGAARKKSK